MKLAIVGVGGAGGRIVDRVLEAERHLDRPCVGTNALVFDTSLPNLEALERISKERRIPIGDTYPGVDLDGDGVDGDVELGVDVAREERPEIRRSFDELEVYNADAVVLVAGLGGGTATGVGAALLEECRTVYDKPVYAVATLPAAAEPDRRALNAAQGLQSFVRTADNTLLFDNEAWNPNSDEEGGRDDSEPTLAEYRTMNEALAIRFVSLFGAGEADRSSLPETAVDTSDLKRTLATGGVSSIGYASHEESDGGLLAWLRSLLGGEDDAEVTDAVSIKTLTERAVRSDLTLPCDVSSAERVMLVLAGPAEALSRRGFENAVYWVEEETGAAEVLAGDEPRANTQRVTATVLLSNVTGVPRIEALKERAVGTDPIVSDERDDEPDGRDDVERVSDVSDPFD